MKLTRLFQILIIASLLFTVAGAPAQPLSVANAQPQLVQMAAEQPDTLVRVIVQEFAGASGAEERVAALGGKVTT